MKNCASIAITSALFLVVFIWSACNSKPDVTKQEIKETLIAKIDSIPLWQSMYGLEIDETILKELNWAKGELANVTISDAEFMPLQFMTLNIGQSLCYEDENILRILKTSRSECWLEQVMKYHEACDFLFNFDSVFQKTNQKIEQKTEAIIIGDKDNAAKIWEAAGTVVRDSNNLKKLREFADSNFSQVKKDTLQ